jgi:hypothetical protein
MYVDDLEIEEEGVADMLMGKYTHSPFEFKMAPPDYNHLL